MDKLELKTNSNINPSDYKYGVVCGRFQLDEPHEAHIELLKTVNKNHKGNLIIFLGVPFIENTEKNPLSFSMRREMLESLFPSALILPIKDNISDIEWTNTLDSLINVITLGQSALLYGGRDSFKKGYINGAYPTIEFNQNFDISATEKRNELKNIIINNSDFRKGVIHSIMNQRPVTYPTVDITIINDKNEILLARKHNETKLRFIGGFVDREDESYLHAAKREFNEETGGNIEISDVKYVCSLKINDYRYEGLKSGIMTTLFIGKYNYGTPIASDDIEELKWVDITKIDIDKDIMPVHKNLMEELFKYVARHTGILNYIK